MYHPTTRLLTVLELLQAHERLSGTELARRLEVAPRSVRRYILMLQDLGIPVEAARGPYGGYRLRPGFKLPPLMFTDEEAFALTLALRAAPRLGLAFAAPARAGALAKLERVLPVALRARLQAVQASVSLDVPPADAAAPSDLVVLFGEAARGGRRVRVRYRSQTGEETERDVDPYGVVCWARYWYVVGYCHLRAGLRQFRLDRVLAAEPRDATFPPPESFDSLGYVIRAIATMPGRWPVEVALGLTMEEARRRVPAAFGTLEPAPYGVIFRCRYDDLDGLARYFVGLGCPLTVHQPAELRAALGRLAREIAAMANGAGGVGATGV